MNDAQKVDIAIELLKTVEIWLAQDLRRTRDEADSVKTMARQWLVRDTLKRLEASAETPWGMLRALDAHQSKTVMLTAIDDLTKRYTGVFRQIGPNFETRPWAISIPNWQHSGSGFSLWSELQTFRRLRSTFSREDPK